MINRREFLQRSAAACAVLGPAGNWALAAGDTADDWAFPLLGDLHFDRLEHHDHEWLKRDHPGGPIRSTMVGTLGTISR